MTASLNPYISKFDEELDVEKSSQYRMTIQCALGGFSFALLDDASKTLLGLEYYQSELLNSSDDLFHALERALEAKDLNHKEFKSVTCIIDERYNALVPQALYNEADQSQYLDFAFQVPNRYTLQAELLEGVGCYNVFAWSKDLKDKIMAKWKHAQVTHSSSVFITSVMQKPEDHCVFVNVRNRDFDMLIQREGKLSFFNNFRFNTKDDFAYFLVFAMEQNGLSGMDTPVCFTGLILPASEIVDLCGRYVRDLCFMEDRHELKVSKALEDVPYQYYYLHYQSFR